MILRKILHIHCSGLLGNRALSQYEDFPQKMVLKRTFSVTLGKTAQHFHCSGLQRDKALCH